MPIIRTSGKSGMIKVSRPNGTRYSESRVARVDSSVVPMEEVRQVSTELVEGFFNEFGMLPDWDNVVIELVSTTIEVTGALYELTDY